MFTYIIYICVFMCGFKDYVYINQLVHEHNNQFYNVSGILKIFSSLSYAQTLIAQAHRPTTEHNDFTGLLRRGQWDKA